MTAIRKANSWTKIKERKGEQEGRRRDEKRVRKVESDDETEAEKRCYS